jgi:2-dehydropantoate 2-reductase
MLQDFERGRRTDIDFSNSYVAQLGRQIGIPIAMNAAMTGIVHLIEQGQIQPIPCSWMICSAGKAIVVKM